MKTHFHLSTSAILFALLVLAGCDDEGTERPASSASTAEAIAKTFVPAADQFGVATFKIVYALEGQETGTRTMWVEDHGARVGIEDEVTTYGQKQHKLYYWDGERGHMQNLPDGKISSMGLRMKSSEPTSFATLPASSLEMAGYTRDGERTILGKTCEHWKNEKLNYEGCRWNQIELEFHNGAGTEKILQTTVATDYVEGEAIPTRIKALAQGN